MSADTIDKLERRLTHAAIIVLFGIVTFFVRGIYTETRETRGEIVETKTELKGVQINQEVQAAQIKDLKEIVIMGQNGTFGKVELAGVNKNK